MSDKINVTVVVFRVWNKTAGSSGVIALFPFVDECRGFCSSYERVGQHGSADYLAVIGRTRPALPAEYDSLKRELESEPYNYRFEVRLRRGKHP